MLIKSVISTESGSSYNVIRFFDSGGEALLYEVEHKHTKVRKVLKVFKEKYDLQEKEQRIKFLMNLQLHKESSHIVTPRELYKENNQVGYIMPFVPGIQLVKFLGSPTINLSDALRISLDLCQLVEKLHRNNIAYGDLSHKNIMINHTGSHFEVYCIDLDNYFTSGAPPSSMAGQMFSIPPEFYQASKNNQKIIPSLSSDQFSLSTILSEIILLLSPTVGSDGSEEEIADALSKPWRLDPVLIDPHTNPFGNYPVGVLDPNLISLFRRGINPDINNRPSVYEWIYALEKALTRIYICPSCSYPTIIDSSKTTCPLGTHPFEMLGIKLKNSQSEIHFTKPLMIIGRDILDNSVKVSNTHLYVEKYGPQVKIKSIGKNGTYRWSGSDWIRLPDNKSVLLKCNDKLRIANVEVEVYRIN